MGEEKEHLYLKYLAERNNRLRDELIETFLVYLQALEQEYEYQAMVKKLRVSNNSSQKDQTEITENRDQNELESFFKRVRFYFRK